MKKIIILIVFLLIILSGCTASNSSSFDSDDDYKLSYSDTIDKSYVYDQMELSVDGKVIPLYNVKTNYSHTWNASAPQRMNNGVGTLSQKGKIKYTLKTSFKILNNKFNIRPLEKDVQYKIVDDKTLEFLIADPGQYTLEFGNDRCLHLFVNEYGMYDEYKTKDNVIYFPKGVHNKNNSKYIGSDNLIRLQSNQTIFIDEGAIVEAGIIANNISNTTIVGTGIISGAVFDRNADTGTKLIPIDFNYCRNIKFLGIAILDPAGWCYNLYFCDTILLDNIKIISSRSNGDGVSLQSCKNSECKNSFVRSWDDSLVVKNYPRWDNRNIEGETEHISFCNCIIWTDLAQSMEIGYETVGELMDDISFEKITVLHNFHKAVISIHNGNNAEVTNVRYKDIIVEDASMGKGDGRNVLIELTCEYSTTWSSSHKITSLGSIDTVTIENMKVLSSSNPLISFRGSIDPRSSYDKTPHYVSNITIKDLYLGDNKIDLSYEKIEQVYTNNVVFE